MGLHRTSTIVAQSLRNEHRRAIVEGIRVNTEHRQITFTVDQTIRALIAFDSKNGLFPKARPVSVRVVENEGTASAVVTLTPGDGGDSFDVRIPPHLLAAAVIELCIHEGIPLPRSAKKRLVKSGDGVSLQMDLSAATTLITDVSDIEAMANKPAEAQVLRQ